MRTRIAAVAPILTLCAVLLCLCSCQELGLDGPSQPAQPGDSTDNALGLVSDIGEAAIPLVSLFGAGLGGILTAGLVGVRKVKAARLERDTQHALRGAAETGEEIARQRSVEVQRSFEALVAQVESIKMIAGTAGEDTAKAVRAVLAGQDSMTRDLVKSVRPAQKQPA